MMGMFMIYRRPKLATVTSNCNMHYGVPGTVVAPSLRERAFGRNDHRTTGVCPTPARSSLETSTVHTSVWYTENKKRRKISTVA